MLIWIQRPYKSNLNFHIWPNVSGTEGKVSQVSSKFGGRCSGSSCGSTPIHSPSSSLPSSPKRSFGQQQSKSGVAKAFEFGVISNPSLASSSVRSSETSPIKTKYGDRPSSASQSVPSSKVGTKTFETSCSSSTSAETPALSPFGQRKDFKTTKVEIPHGRDHNGKEGIMSLEIQTSGDKTIRIEVSHLPLWSPGTDKWGRHFHNQPSPAGGYFVSCFWWLPGKNFLLLNLFQKWWKKNLFLPHLFLHVRP